MSRAASDPSRISAAERTAIMLTTAFQEVEAIMVERRLKPAEVAFEYGHRLVYKAWTLLGVPDDASREQFRDAAISYMSSVADRVIDTWGEPSGPPRESLSARDVVVDAEEAARLAGLALRPQDVGLVGEVHAVVEITPPSKPLVRALSAAVIGGFDPVGCAYVVSGADLVEGLPAHVPSHLKIINAFVAPLRARGFVVGVHTVIGGDR